MFIVPVPELYGPSRKAVRFISNPPLLPVNVPKVVRPLAVSWCVPVFAAL